MAIAAQKEAETMQKIDGSLPASIFARLRNRKERADAVMTSQNPRSPGLLVASYNVHKCVGVDGKFNPERTSRVIRELNADVIALQEADRRFGDREGLLDLADLHRETGLLPVPVSGWGKAHGWHGNVLLFKKGSVSVVHQIRLPGLEPRGAIVAEIDLESGGAIRVIAAHLGLLRRSRAQQARMVLDIMNRRNERPTLLLGDLNEWRLGDRSALNELRAAFGPLPPAVPSFPSRLPLLALDRIMANRKDILSKVLVHDTPLAREASDHLPIKAFLTLPSMTESHHSGQAGKACHAA